MAPAGHAKELLGRIEMLRQPRGKSGTFANRCRPWRRRRRVAPSCPLIGLRTRAMADWYSG